MSVLNLARVIKFTLLGPSLLLLEFPIVLATVLVVDGAVDVVGGGASVVGGALEDVVGGGASAVGGALEDVVGGVFAVGGAFVSAVVGDEGILTFSPPGEGNEASCMGRILLGVFLLDCR